MFLMRKKKGVHVLVAVLDLQPPGMSCTGSRREQGEQLEAAVGDLLDQATSAPSSAGPVWGLCADYQSAVGAHAKARESLLKQARGRTFCLATDCATCEYILLCQSRVAEQGFHSFLLTCCAMLLRISQACLSTSHPEAEGKIATKMSRCLTTILCAGAGAAGQRLAEGRGAL